MMAFAPAMLLAAALVWQAGATGTANDLATRVQQRYDGIRDFEAEFSQSYEGGVLRTRTSERGTVSIKRPGRMKWVYTQPERKEFVSDGLRIYAYIPADKQVIVSPVPAAGQTTPALFLSGQGDLARDFTPSFMELPGAPTGLTGLKLVPRKEDPDYEWMAIGVDPASLQIRYLTAADRQGGRSTFTFTAMKENRGLSDKMFEFRIPRGVDVITNGQLPK
jgi:outer membrane lipoprotein carrier protein